MTQRKKRAQKITPKFEGALAQPIPWTGPEFRPQSLLETDEEYAVRQARETKEREAANFRALAETFRKLEPLREHYGIEAGGDPLVRTMMLLFRVCGDFIPGFKIEFKKPQRGRPNVWTAIRYTELVADIEAVKRRKGCGNKEACRTLIREAEKAAGGRYKRAAGVSLEKATSSLEARLSEARRAEFNPLAVMLDKAPEMIGAEKFRDFLIESFGATEYRT